MCTRKMVFSLLFLMAIAGTVQSQSGQESTSPKNKRSARISSISIDFTNSHTALPFGSFSKLFTGPLHPGFEIGTEFNWATKKKHDWFQSVRIGYSYHRLVQHSMVLYTEGGYRYKFQKGFSSSVKLGGGYMRAVIANQVFSDGQGNDPQYKKITTGRSQAIVMTTFNVTKQTGPKGFKVYLEYQQRLQTPFIQAYVNLLPYNIFITGVSIPLTNNKN